MGTNAKANRGDLNASIGQLQNSVRSFNGYKPVLSIELKTKMIKLKPQIETYLWRKG